MEILIFFRVLLLLGFICSSLYWVDWSKWQIYYPTMLFVITVNLVASYLSYHHTLWLFHPDPLVTTHTVLNLLSTFSLLPLTALLFLSGFPSGRLKQLIHITCWIVLYAAIEFVDEKLGGISYLNGWSLWNSVFLDCAMFPLIALHHRQPLLAWFFTILVAAAVLIAFDFINADMK